MKTRPYLRYEGKLSLRSNLWWTTALTLRCQSLRNYAAVVPPDEIGRIISDPRCTTVRRVRAGETGKVKDRDVQTERPTSRCPNFLNTLQADRPHPLRLPAYRLEVAEKMRVVTTAELSDELEVDYEMKVVTTPCCHGIHPERWRRLTK